jgi:hypothetical protein
MRAWVVWMFLAGCWDEDDDLCDPTNVAIDLLPIDPVPDHWEMLPTAVGGMQRATAGSYDACGTPQMPSQITVTSSDPSTVTTMVTDTQEFAMQALAAGTSTLSITNAAGLLAVHTVEARPINAVTFSAPDYGKPLVFYPGHTATIDLLDVDGKPLVDHALEVAGDLPRGAVWDQLDLGRATAGDHVVQVVAGSSTWLVPLRVVAAIDAIVPEHGSISAPDYGSQEICFFAESGGQQVSGISWHFSVDQGSSDTSYFPNCVRVWSDTARTMTVTASALGLSATTTVQFIES